MTPDLFNALFEFVGGIMILVNCLAVARDRCVAGVRWWPVAFFAAWGAWNIFYYPYLEQHLSFVAGIFIFSANLLWVGLLLRYRKRTVAEIPRCGMEAGPRGDYLETYTGVQFFPLDPREEDVNIADVARSLAMQVRYKGHVTGFYSVAEHCCIIADYARYVEKRKPRELFHALMHDAGEPYTTDVPKPFKINMPSLKDMERSIERVVMAKFGLPVEKPAWLTSLDQRIIRDERDQVKNSSVNKWWHDRLEPLGITVEFWTPARAEIEFLRRYTDYTGSQLVQRPDGTWAENRSERHGN